MTRYTRSSQGVVVGYNNTFFFRDIDGSVPTFKAILWVEGYQHDHDSHRWADTITLKTPAEQLVYTETFYRWPTSGRDFMLGSKTLHTVLTPKVRKWLETENIRFSTRPIRTPTLGYGFEETTPIFFHRVKDARWLRDKIEDSLKGFPKIPEQQ